MKSSTGHAEWLNYNHLRYFHAIAREGSLRRAAEDAGLFAGRGNG
jgi:molybdenum-dependent DNA-binding transcriptional regulator ModE